MMDTQAEIVQAEIMQAETMQAVQDFQSVRF